MSFTNLLTQQSILLDIPPAIRAFVSPRNFSSRFRESCRARRHFSCSAIPRAGGGGHENPLGLPRSGTPPNLAARMKRGLPEKRPIPNVTSVVAVSSAKGGVGKSTVAANLALAAAKRGVATGLLDVDIYGPSLPTLLGLEGLEPALDANNRLVPLAAYGLQAMSMGSLIPADSPVAWRGLMVQKALQQLLFEVAWQPLDLLVLDFPPGTGDVQLTVTQSVELAGAVVVSTPQDLALRDAVRGVDLFRRVGTPILGLVQNMSSFVCSNCGHSHEIFGLDGAKRKALDLKIPWLGDIPLHPQICSDADAGRPTVVADPDGALATAYRDIADRMLESLALPL